MPLRLAHFLLVITCFRCFFGASGSERATAAGEARRNAPAAWHASRSRAGGWGLWERQAARRRQRSWESVGEREAACTACIISASGHGQGLQLRKPAAAKPQ